MLGSTVGAKGIRDSMLYKQFLESGNDNTDTGSRCRKLATEPHICQGHIQGLSMVAMTGSVSMLSMQ